jgi:endonuclease-3
VYGLNNKYRIEKIKEIFEKVYAVAECSLDYKTPLELLIATQLAAQCTDARVNIVTKDLFRKYKNINDFANADITELENNIKSTGFYRNKAKNIINCCKMLINDFNSTVPDNMDDLIKLPGVGRKTANIIIGDIYKKPSYVIDTHAKRLSNRIGLSKNSDPTKIEFDLRKIISPEYSTKFCHQLVLHGRAICNARKPKCNDCPINHFCDYYITNNK